MLSTIGDRGAAATSIAAKEVAIVIVAFLAVRPVAVCRAVQPDQSRFLATKDAALSTVESTIGARGHPSARARRERRSVVTAPSEHRRSAAAPLVRRSSTLER